MNVAKAETGKMRIIEEVKEAKRKRQERTAERENEYSQIKQDMKVKSTQDDKILYKYKKEDVCPNCPVADDVSYQQWKVNQLQEFQYSKELKQGLFAK